MTQANEAIMFVLDSHCDTPSQILRLRDIGADNERGHVDIPKMRKGGVDASFFALYTPSSKNGPEATAYAMELLAAVNDALDAAADKSALALTPEQAIHNKRQGLLSVFLGMENGAPIGKSLPLLREFWRLGVRYMTLVHSADNLICDSCASKDKTWHGLSPFGREVIAEMNRLGMLIDVSHASDEAFFDVIETSAAPVVATHSCCRALATHPRNMSDEMIRALAARGGVIQINFYPVFLDDRFAEILSRSGLAEKGEAVEAAFIADPADARKRLAWNKVQDELMALPRPSFKRVVDHIDHAVSVAGIDHVGIGSDFDGIEVTPEGLEDISCMPAVFEEMRARGYSEEEIAKVAGGNFLRVMSDARNIAGIRTSLF